MPGLAQTPARRTLRVVIAVAAVATLVAAILGAMIVSRLGEGQALWQAYNDRVRTVVGGIGEIRKQGGHGGVEALEALDAMLARVDTLTAEYEQQAVRASDQARYLLGAGGALLAFALLVATLFNLRQMHKLVVASDELAASESRLEAAAEEARRANEAKTQFLSRMSHELRTPLNAILGFSQVLEGAGLAPDDADSVQEIRKAGAQLLGYVNEMLELSQIEGGRIELNMKPMDAGAAIGACIAQVMPLAAARSIAITTAQPLGEIPVHADAQRLEQILLNLFSNAIKFNKDGGRIEVATCTADGRVRIAVSDTGKGIAPENMARLFRPFERIEGAYEGIGGAGIGLARVKRLVEAMGGMVGVASEVGKGSTFWITLPLAAEADAE